MGFKASPSSQHQNCTDEAQKAETVRASDVLVVFFQKEMPTQDEYPKSVVLHSSPSVYQKIGAAEMIPKLLEIFNVEDLRCLQFLRNGKVRVSFREKEVRDHYLVCLLYTSPSPRDQRGSRMPSSA